MLSNYRLYAIPVLNPHYELSTRCKCAMDTYQYDMNVLCYFILALSPPCECAMTKLSLCYQSAGNELSICDSYAITVLQICYASASMCYQYAVHMIPSHYQYAINSPSVCSCNLINVLSHISRPPAKSYQYPVRMLASCYQFAGLPTVC